MRLRHAIIKRSLGRVLLHDLRSAYYAELNSAAVAALNASLAGRGEATGDSILAKLSRRGMVEDAPYEPIPERQGSDLVSLELEPVGTCNLECGHCFAGFSGAVMSEATFEAALRGAERLGAVEVTFNGGEPLMHRSTLDWIERTARQGLRTLLFTNGTLVTQRTAQRLADARVARVTVSMDGFEQVHDALRGPGAYRRAEAGIRKLVEAGLAVYVTTAVHPGNEHEVTALHKHCKENLGVTGLRVTTVAAMGRAAGRPDLQLPVKNFRAVYENEPAKAPHTTGGRLPCSAGVDKLYVTARGEVHACHLFDGVTPPLGLLADEPLEAIYGSLEQRRGGALLRRFQPDELHACRGCPALATCVGGCRARAWQMTGDPMGNDPVSCQKYGGTPLALPSPLSA
jgi:radical SAM protein with 4Fe4S-binding SPASM domain